MDDVEQNSNATRPRQMRLWLLIPGAIFLICGIVMMFAIGFSFVMGVFTTGSVSVSIWHLILPLSPIAFGLAMIWFAPMAHGPEKKR